jgi:monothiol glutaredoxin
MNATRNLMQRLAMSSALRLTGHTAMPTMRATVARCLSGAAPESSFDGHSDFSPKKKLDTTDSGDVNNFIESEIKANPVMLFMKGTAEAPQCGFSYQVVRILHAHGVKFSAVNVLEDDAIRNGIKEFSDWPTIPQLYVEGEFVGGCDIVTQLHQSGELEEMLAPIRNKA